jgi:putative membrane protein
VGVRAPDRLYHSAIPMNAEFNLLFTGWRADPLTIAAVITAAIGYAVTFGRSGRWPYFVAAVALVAFALLSPLDALAQGVLFSAHMAQHIILLVLAPALVLLSLPIENPTMSLRGGTRDRHERSRLSGMGATMLAWFLGVGSMWFWHVPALCNAAATSAGVHAVQTFSLLGMGGAFWWPILAPRPAHRLSPGAGIAYLFTACLACTALGILITFTSVEVCTAFRAPVTAAAPWARLRGSLTRDQDQQIGGLLMWLPMCTVYVAAILLELSRWFGAQDQLANASPTHE